MYLDFKDWVEDYTPDTYGYSCGAGIKEDHVLTLSGKMYQTVMTNTCDQWNMEYEVTMSNEDWENIFTYYITFDSAGNEKKKTVLKECIPDPSNADWKKCTFILGKLS